MRPLSRLLGFLLLCSALFTPTANAQENPNDALVQRCRAALAALAEARTLAQATAESLRANDARLTELAESLLAELPDEPQDVETYTDFEATYLEERFQEQTKYLEQLEAREALKTELEELLATQQDLLGRLPDRSEAFAALDKAATDSLNELGALVLLEEVEYGQETLGSDKSIAELLQEIEAERQLSRARVEMRELMAASLERAREALPNAVLPSPELLAEARFQFDAAELFISVIFYEQERVTVVLADAPEIAAAELETRLRKWAEEESSYPALLQQAVELRATYAARKQALAELSAPDASTIEEGEGHPELRAARKDLAFAEAVEAFRARQVQLIKELTETEVALRDLDLELGTATRAHGEQAVMLSAQVRAVEQLMAEEKLTSAPIAFDEQDHWVYVRALALEATRRSFELEQLELSIANLAPLEAAELALEAQRAQVRIARTTFDEETNYGTLVEEMGSLTEEQLIDAVSTKGGLAAEVIAVEEALTETRVAFNDGAQHIDEVMALLELLDSPHTQAEIERAPQRVEEIFNELTQLSQGKADPLPRDSSQDQERQEALSTDRQPIEPDVSSRKSALPSENELSELEQQQVSARSRQQYFQDFEELVIDLREAQTKLVEQATLHEEQLAKLIELERRRYVSAFELQSRLSSGAISKLATPKGFAKWTSREGVSAAMKRRSDYRLKRDKLDTRLRTELTRFDALLAPKEWAELGGEVAQEKVHLISLPVAHLRASETRVEDLKEYERENLLHLSHELEIEERPWQFSLLKVLGKPDGSARFQKTLDAYYLELVNLGRVHEEFGLARDAYQQLIELNINYRDELSRSLSAQDMGLAVRNNDYQVLRYQAAIVANPKNRIMIMSLFRTQFGAELPSPAEDGDLSFWTNRLLAVEARLWGARRWDADLRYKLSLLGIESEINRYRTHVAQIEAELAERENAAKLMRQRIVELREGRAAELKRAGLMTALRIAIIPLLILLSLKVLRYMTGRMRQKAAAHEDDDLTDRRRRLETLTNVVGTSVTVLVWIIAAIYVLAALGLDVTPIIASASVMGLAIAFGAQALIKDYFSGFFILLENQYTVGDVIDLGSANGTVEHISLRVTVVRDLSGVVHYVPNGLISTVSNKTKGWSRVVMEVRIGYDQDVEKVTQVLQEVLAEMQATPKWAATILDKPDVLGVQSFGESAIDLRLLVKTLPGQQWAVSRELRARIKRRFDERGISIPVPHRVVHHVQAEQASNAQGSPTKA